MNAVASGPHPMTAGRAQSPPRFPTYCAFDLPELEKQFVVHGMREGEEWTLGFAPRDPTLASSLGSIIVQGRQTSLDRIEMVKSDEQRIEIIINDSQSDVIFAMDVLQRFFR